MFEERLPMTVICVYTNDRVFSLYIILNLFIKKICHQKRQVEMTPKARRQLQMGYGLVANLQSTGCRSGPSMTQTSPLL